jgi:hypothetical protein
MMSRNFKIALAILGAAVLFGLLSLRGLHQRVQRLAESQATEEQARRAVVAPPISTPTDVQATAKIFWASASSPDHLEPTNVELALSADAALRSKQLLRKLIADPPSPAQQTLPTDLAVLSFYALPDGTAIVDFSDALTSEIPSGILSEGVAVSSITRTLEANVTSLHRLKILIHGQEADTVAGHVDLTGFFDLHPPGSGGSGATVAESATPAGSQPVELTVSGAPGKLKP